MRRIIILFCYCLVGMSTPVTPVAQRLYTNDSIELKGRIYEASVITPGSKKSRGYLASLPGSNLYLFPSALPFGPEKMNGQVAIYQYDQLEKVTIKRKGSVVRRAWQGALVGFAVGAISSLVSGDVPTPVVNNPNDVPGTAFNIYTNSFAITAGQKAVGFGILGAGAGGCIGALLGAFANKKFITGRNQQEFNALPQNIPEKFRVQQIKNILLCV